VAAEVAGEEVVVLEVVVEELAGEESSISRHCDRGLFIRVLGVRGTIRA
jgi:hypothetical protein